MYRSFILVIVCFSIVATTEANSKVLVSDCGDRSHLLHFKRIAASDLIRGKDVTIDSEKELLTANITSGTVDFECLRDDTSVYRHQFNYCGYQEVSLPLGLGKVKFTGSDCSKPRPYEDSFHMKGHVPLIIPGGKYEFTLKAKGSDGERLYCSYAYTKL